MQHQYREVVLARPHPEVVRRAANRPIDFVPPIHADALAATTFAEDSGK
ncbi:hypothetical protein [Streptomyces sp. NBC_00057]